ncbi:MAG: PaaX family transcriptional regulator [Myxococcales bacterium]|nr:PaaX family transcriptional regulator [Deltaproteobacteria bacterium]NND28740.1 PaaX family transcriptional regulator [Myxococcales bacterium]MBT8479987.1 PaaX family transcriptional regulator [Deltaproteobacteria bacterium]NNK43226.1 PaaX family transcriptional regulator [Myxococcales bacterium]NNL22855.1 PaaX family transcriptional regulator [Myxococcales bacterium]
MEYRRISRNVVRMDVSAKAVVLEVLSAGESIVDGTLPVRALVQAASVFDIAENSVRVAIVRLRAEGLLESPNRGEYRLGPSAQMVNERIHGWRTVSSRLGEWDGSWAAVFTADLSRTDRPALRRRQRALRYLGFEQLKTGLFLRPNNLKPGIHGLRAELRGLGLDSKASVFRMEDLNPEQDACARALWDSPSLEQTYSRLHGDLKISMDRLEELPINDSVREAFLLGREGIRQVVLDPLLPAPMVDTDKRSTMVHLLQSYCDKGLHLWARFLAID